MDKEIVALLGTDDRILEFEKIIRLYSMAKKDGCYRTSGLLHAAIIWGNLFKNTTKSLHILGEDLKSMSNIIMNNKYCKKYFEEMILNNNLEINIIVRNHSIQDVDSGLMNTLLVLNPHLIQFYVLKDLNKNIFQNNFILSNIEAYRWEKDINNNTGSFSFNDTESSVIIKDYFEKIIKYCDHIYF